MADTGIFATTAEVSRKAGANASTTSNTEAYINQFMAEAESEINATTLLNWSDVYATINGDNKEILKQAASNLAAMYVIQFDMSGFTSRFEAETMLDVLDSNSKRDMSILKASNKKDFVAKT